MFERPLSEKSRSTRPLMVSLVVHGAFVTALFAIHFTVQRALGPLRNTRVLLMTPQAPPAVKRIAAPTRPSEPKIRAELKLPPPRLAAPAPRLLEPPIIRSVERAPGVLVETPKPAAPPPPIHPDVFASAPVSKPVPAPPAQVQTGGFSAAAPASTPSARAQLLVAAGFGDAGTISA